MKLLLINLGKVFTELDVWAFGKSQGSKQKTTIGMHRVLDLVAGPAAALKESP